MSGRNKRRWTAIAPIAFAVLALAAVATRRVRATSELRPAEPVVATPLREPAIPPDTLPREPTRRAPASVHPTQTETSPALSPHGASNDLILLKAQIADLKTCYEKPCSFPTRYPHDYTNSVGQSLKAKISDLAAYAQTNQLIGEDLAEIARDGLANPDGHVKEAALRLLATQEPSPANRDALVAGVLADHDESLVPQALLELRRYDLAGAPLVHDTLIASMVHGAPYVAVAIAEHIEPFIDESTYPRYETALAGLAPGTKAHAALLAALEQYRLHRSGA